LEVDGSGYRDVGDTRAWIASFIEAVHNCQRMHSALDFLSRQTATLKSTASGATLLVAIVIDVQLVLPPSSQWI
jgi:hypothetical protein